jgi:hypothetical protein
MTRMNRRMSQLLGRFNISLSTLASSSSAAKKEFITVGESLLLKKEFEQAKGVNANNFPDRTGFECFVNHVHLAFDGTQQSLQSCLEYAMALRNQLAKIGKDRQFMVILTLSDDDCVVRFHELRKSERWLADDLETYREEAVLALVAGEPEHCLRTGS